MKFITTKILLTTVMLCGYYFHSNAQTFQWSKKIGSTGNDFALAITSDLAGNIYTTGAFTGTIDIDPGTNVVNLTAAGNSDVFIAKYTSNGSLIWAKQVGGSSLDQGNAIKVDGSGNVYVGGTFATTVDFDPGPGVASKTVAAASDAFILKLNSLGDFDWVSVFAGTGNEQVKGLDVDASGNVLSTGFWYMTCDFDPGPGTNNILASVTNSQSSAFIAKLDNSGAFVWAGEIGAGQFHEGYTVTTDASGNVYFGGYTLGGTDYDPGAATVNLPFGGQQEAFIVKLNSAGAYINAVKLNGASGDMLYSLDLDASGNVVATGYYTGTTDFDPGAGAFNITSAGVKDIFVLKLNSSLGFLWAKSIGGTSDDVGYGIMTDNNDNIYLTGLFQSTVDFDPGVGVSNKTSAGGNDVFVLKLDASGNLAYNKKFGGSASDAAFGITGNIAGSQVYTAGYFTGVCNFKTETGDYFMESSASSQDIFMHKLGDCITTTPQSITATSNNICAGTGTSITMNNSDPGLNYYLINDATNMIIDGPIVGNGSTISFNTGNMSATSNFSVSGFSAPLTTNYALDLDGTNDYLDLGTSNRSITSSITISAKVRTTINGASQFIADKYLSGGIGYYLFINASGQASLQGRDVAGVLKSSGLSTTIVADNQWHEITGVVRSTGWEIWIDGVLENSGAYTFGATGLGTTASFLVGQFGAVYSPLDIDRLAIWNTSLSASEIGNLGSSCLNGNEANLVGYFPFNEGNGTNSIDFSSTATNATLVNMTVPADWVAGSGLNCTGLCENNAANQATVTVIPNPSQPTISAGGPTTFCTGGSVTLTSSVGSSYLWSNGATTASISPSTPGTYSVQIANASGCQSVASSGTSITVNSLPATPTVSAGGPTTFCTGGSVTLTSSAGTSYLWSNGATTASINATTTGTYSVQVTNAQGCQSAASAGTTVTVNITPAQPTITTSGPTALCSGGSVTLTSSAGSSYLWSTGATTASITVSSAGTYSVQVTNASGCLSIASSGTTVTVGSPPTTPTITAGGPTTFCAGGSVTLTSSAGNSYLWSNGATTASISPTTSGTYSVQVTNAAGCQSTASTGTIVTVNSLPTTPTITAGGPTTFCAGGSVTLTSSAGNSYLWSNGATTVSISPTAAGTYSVQVTNAAGCQSTASTGTTVTVNANPAIPTITAGGPTTFCAGGSVTLTSSAGNSYLWSNGATSASISPTAAGTYSVQVTNAAGCQSTASAGTSVTVNANPATPTITAGGPTTFCAGGSVTLTSSTGTSYLWSNGATTASISPTTAGTYSVQVTNAAGCQSTASTGTTVTVNAVPAQPSITAGGPTTFCSGGSVTLTSSPGTSYLWTGGSLSSSINPSSSGTFTVQVTNAAGCQSIPSSPVTVTVHSLPNAPIISPNGPTTFCEGGSVNLASSAGITYLWSNGSTNFSINPTTSGTFTVQITDPNGCLSPASAPTTVTVNANPVISLGTVSNPTSCTTANGSIQVSGTSTGNLSWSGAASGTLTNVTLPTTISSLTNGSYNITLTNGNGCTSNVINGVLTTPAAPAAPTISATGGTVLCAGQSVVLNSTAGSSYLWSNGETTSSITASVSGNYSVSITDASGCSSPSSNVITVTVHPQPTITAGTLTNPSSCVILDGSIQVSGTGTGDLSWSGGAVGSVNGVTLPYTIPNLGQGSYSIVHTDANGCNSATLVVNLTAPGAPAAPTISANGATTFCQGGSVDLTASTGTSYLWSNGETTATISVNSPGTYSVIITDANGCTSPSSDGTVVVIDQMPDLTVSMTANVITATQSGATYQWVDCSNGNAPIGGATGQSFTPVSNGSYACEISFGTCSGISSCTVISTVGLDENNSKQVQIYPNPTTNILNISIADENSVEGNIYTSEGKFVLQFNGNSVDVSSLARGVYIVEIRLENTNQKIRFVKE